MLPAWGKTDKESGEFHPLAHHSMDVAAVFAQMLQLPVVRDRLKAAAGASLTELTCRRLAALAFLHDIGKLHPGFQAKGWASSLRLDLAQLFRTDLAPGSREKRLVVISIQTVPDHFLGSFRLHGQARRNHCGAEEEHDLPGAFEDRPHLHSKRVQVAGLVGSEHGVRVDAGLAK